MLGCSFSVWGKVRNAVTAAAAIMAMGSASAWALPCVDGATFDTYISVGSCSVGDKTFSDFTYTAVGGGGATPIPASGVTVRTLGPAGSGAGILNVDIGLRFIAPWTVASGQFLDSNLSFLVTAPDALLKDVGLAMSGASATGTGIANVAENVYTNSTLATTIASLTTTKTETITKLFDEAEFAPRTSLYVIKDISVNGGTSGTASISLVQNTFSQIPEPASLALLGSALLGLGLFRRRRNGTQSV